MRNPNYSGIFYPATKLELLTQLDLFFRVNTEFFSVAKGIIVPHAGYNYSGKIAAKTYKAISKIKKRKFAIFGVNHSGVNLATTSKQDWKTPLGIAKIDRVFSDKILTQGIITQNETVMKEEHSIEVQMPFLQYLFKDFEFVPVQLPYLPYDKILELRDILLDEEHFFIASSDLIHYGASFGFVPSESLDNPPDYVKKLDGKLINIIKEFNGKIFYDFIVRNNLTVCGFVPITLLIEITKKLGAKKIEKISYDNSFSLSKDSSHIVGYSGLVIC